MLFIRRSGWVAFVISSLLLYLQLFLHQAVVDDVLDIMASNAVFDGVKPSESIVTCRANTKIPNRVFFPVRFMNQPSVLFEEFRKDFLYNKHYMRKSYVIFGDQSESRFSVFFSLFKNGGTTVENLQTRISKKILHNRFTGDDIKAVSDRKELEDAFNKKVVKLLKDVKEQERPMLFTFVRDPVSRFLSALQHVASVPRRLLELCPCDAENDPIKFVECVLNKIEKKGSYLDPTLVPQTYQILSAVEDREDIGTQIFSLSDMDEFVSFCSNGNPRRKYRQSKNKKGGVKLPDSNFLSPKLRARICKVYRIDVMLLQALNGLVPMSCL